MQVDIWSDVACPWCFIGKRRFEQALGEFEHRDDVQVVWHSYQLDPSLPERHEGTELDYLSTSKGMAPDQVRQMFTHVAGQAAGEGLTLDFERVVVANSHRAHELLQLAKERYGAGDPRVGEVKEALLSAHFERGEDIGSRDLLRRIGGSVGLGADEVDEALDTGRLRDAVEVDIAQARRLGVGGVPFFVVDGRFGVSGAQPSELFAQVLDRAWAERE